MGPFKARVASACFTLRFSPKGTLRTTQTYIALPAAAAWMELCHEPATARDRGRALRVVLQNGCVLLESPLLEVVRKAETGILTNLHLNMAA